MAANFLFPLFVVYRIRFLTNGTLLKKPPTETEYYTYRHWGWTPQYPIRFRQSYLSEPEENEMDWEKALRFCNGTVLTPSMRNALSMPADSYTTFSSPQTLSCFKRHLPSSFKGEAVDPINLIHGMVLPDYILSLAKATPRVRAIKPWSVVASAVSSHHIGITSCLYYMQFWENVKCY